MFNDENSRDEVYFEGIGETLGIATKHDLLGIVITECINYRFGKNIWNCLALDWTECDTYIMQYL